MPTDEQENQEVVVDETETTVEETVETPEFVITKVPDEEEGNGFFVNAEDEVEGEVEETVEEEIVEQTIENTPIAEEVKETVAEIDDARVLEFLKQKGIDATSLEDLKPKEQKKLAPEVEKFIEFTEKTGNSNYNDFLETQKDWSQVDDSVKLKEYLRLDNPDLDADEIDFLFNEKYSYDEDIDTDGDIMRRKISTKTDLRKANELLEQRKQEYMVERGSDEHIPVEFREAKSRVSQIEQEQQQYNDAVQKQTEYFLQETEKVFSNNFEGFEVKVGDKSYKVKPQNVQEQKKLQSDVSNIISKYIDKNTGLIKDAAGYHKMLFAASDPEGFAKHFLEIGKSEYAEQDAIESKNITPGMRQVPQNGKKPMYVVKKAD